jgi:hypothetical protein
MLRFHRWALCVALVTVVGLAAHTAIAQNEAAFAVPHDDSALEIPVAKNAVPPGVYKEFNAKDLVTLSSMAWVVPDLGKKAAVVYVHRLPENADLYKVAAELKPKLADGSIRSLIVPKQRTPSETLEVTDKPEGALSQLKNLASKSDGEIALVSFERKITSAIDTEPSKWITWDVGGKDAEKSQSPPEAMQND